MISATHFVEVITVDNGPSNTTACGQCELIGANSWVLSPKAGKNWFNNQASFPPDSYTLELTSLTKLSPKLCNAVGDFSWYVGRVAEPISNTTAIDLTKWTALAYGNALAGKWVLDSNKSGVTQTDTGTLSFCVSNFALIDETFSITCTVGNPTDNRPIAGDYFGVAWGFSSVGSAPNSYYLLAWKQQVSPGTNNPGFIMLAKVTNSSNETNSQMFTRLYSGASWTDGTAYVEVLARTDGAYTSWTTNNPYIIQVTYQSNGTSTVTLTDTIAKKQIWTTTYQDAQSLGVGQIAFYNLDQENVHYSVNATASNAIIYNSPVGSICTANENYVTFNGVSDDIVIIYGASDIITTSYSGIPGDPITYYLPAKCILVADSSGNLIGSGPPIPNNPKTAEKIFISGTGASTRTHVVAEGTKANVGTGHVSDFAINGFQVIHWGQAIPVSTYSGLGWVTPDGTFNFKVSFIPSGVGNVTVSNVTVSGPTTPPPVVPINWTVIEDLNGFTMTEGNAPSVVGQSVSFALTQAASIGVNLITTPSNLTSPQFKLTSKAITIKNPKVITWVQQNPGGRNLYYDFIITVNGITYDSRVPSEAIYFQINDQQWNLSSTVIPPLGEETVTFIIPFDTIQTSANVTTIVNGVESSAFARSMPIIPRVVTRTSLACNRDLIDPDIKDLTALLAAQRRYIKTVNYTPYLFANNRLTAIQWSNSLSNGDTLVCIANDVDMGRALNYLINSRDILPRRYVQATS